MEAGPLASDVLFRVGPVPVARAVISTWILMAGLVAIARLAFARPADPPGRLQTAVEIVVEAIVEQLRMALRRDPAPWLPLLGTLFLFLASANLTAVLPGAVPPTGHIETPLALAIVVFVTVHLEGLRARGVRGHLREYLEPTPLLLPLHIVSEISRTFALAVRLFGNMMSHEMVVAVLLLLAGFLVPVPFQLLAILIGLVQAYVFTLLAAVFLAAAIGSGPASRGDGT